MTENDPTAPTREIRRQDDAPLLQVGPHTLRLAGRTLEQSLGAVWQAIIETHGYDPAEGWEVQIESIVLLRKTPAPLEGGVSNGAPPTP